MNIAKVVGTVVASEKVSGLEGSKLLLIQPLDHHLKPMGAHEVAVDCVRAGEQDLVYIVGSREAALALENYFVPVDCAIVGIVDEVDV